MPDVDSAGKEAAKILRDFSEMRLLEAFLVLVIGLALVMALKWALPKIADRMPDRFRLWIVSWEPILRILMLVAIVVYVTPLFIRPTPSNLLAISGGLAVALGFAFKDYVSSLIAGVVAIYERPYRNGDWVKIEDAYGEVQSHNLRTVQVLTPDDTLVAIPHSKMWSEAIHNDNNGQRTLMCVADFYLHPDHDGLLVGGKLRDVALASPYLSFDHPVVVIAAEQPWGTHYRLKAYPIDARDQFLFTTDLTLRGKAMLRRMGVKPALAPAAAPMA